jgi:4-hydroxy-2-oxoheptanedioate aldolase
MIKENFLKTKLDSGKVVMGTWSIIPSPVVADIISQSGLDFIIIDNEHGPISFETAQEMMMACELNGVSPLYRPPGVIESDILKGLDIGAHGLQVPNVESADQVNTIIKYSKFPPLGNRGFSPFVRAAGYSNINSEQQFAKANDNVLVGVNIEGEKGIKNFDSFLSLDELDIIFIGTFDLSKVLGIPGDVENPILLKELERMSKKARNAGKNIGTITTSDESIRRCKDFGMNYLVHYVDCEMLRKSYSNAVGVLNEVSNV